MIPILLDPARARVALIGRGERALARLDWLRRGGVRPDVWSDAPSQELRVAAGSALKEGYPSEADLARCHAVWIADLPIEQAQELAARARAEGALVNVEDVVPLCDFHTPAVVRRGALTLAVGTGGASPAVARAARERLEAAFPESWGSALKDIAKARKALRAEGVGPAALAEDARTRLAQSGLI